MIAISFSSMSSVFLHHRSCHDFILWIHTSSIENFFLEYMYKHTHYVHHLLHSSKKNGPNLKHSIEMFGVLPTDPLGGGSNWLAWKSTTGVIKIMVHIDIKPASNSYDMWTSLKPTSLTEILHSILPTFEVGFLPLSYFEVSKLLFSLMISLQGFESQNRVNCSWQLLETSSTAPLYATCTYSRKLASPWVFLATASEWLTTHARDVICVDILQQGPLPSRLHN